MQRGKELNLTTLGRGIVNHPFLLLTPIIVVMSLLIAYSTEVSLYRSSAIVSFEYAFDANTDVRAGGSSNSDQIKGRLVRSLLIGEPLRRIVVRSWPEINPKDDPLVFNQKAQSLRGAKGLELEFKRENPNALTVAYTSRSAQESFSVVKATIDTLLSLSEEDTKNRIEKSVSFLTKEREANREKLNELEQQILKLRSGLPENALRKYDREQVLSRTFPNLVATVTGDSQTSRQEMQSELQLKLSVLEREYERLQKSLEDKPESLKSDPDLYVNIDSDPRIQQYSKDIAGKEQQLNAMIFKGLRDAHPQRRNLQAEINSLLALREERAEELMNSSGSSETTDLVMQKRAERIRAKMETKKQEIEELREKVGLLQAVKAESDKERENFDEQLGEISQQTSRLAQLESERALTIENYNQISKRLEASEREGRVEEDDAGFKITVVERPRVPNKPVPLAHLPLLLMGLMFSSAGGLALALLAESLNSTVFNAKELQKVISIPILGTIDAMVTTEELIQKRRKRGIIITALVIFVILAKPICRMMIG